MAVQSLARRWQNRGKFSLSWSWGFCLWGAEKIRRHTFTPQLPGDFFLVALGHIQDAQCPIQHFPAQAGLHARPGTAQVQRPLVDRRPSSKRRERKTAKGTSQFRPALESSSCINSTVFPSLLSRRPSRPTPAKKKREKVMQSITNH